MVLHSLSGLFPPGTATNQYSFSDAMTPTHLTLVGGGGYWTEHTPMGVVSREGAAMDELEQVSFSFFHSLSFILVQEEINAGGTINNESEEEPMEVDQVGSEHFKAQEANDTVSL